MHHGLKDIKSRGGKVRFVNPRRIEASTPETGDTIQIKPDTDVYFLAGISNEIYQKSGFDEVLLAKYGRNVDQYKSFISEWPIERVASVTGLSEEEIRQVAEEIITARSAAVYLSTGVNQGRQGTLSFWLTEMLNFATGNLGKEGGTYKARGLSEPMPEPTVTHEFETADGSLPLGGLGALPAVLMPDMMEAGEIKGLISIAGNPLMSMSGEERIRRGFEGLEFILGIDILPNDTLEMADIIMPATDWLEREDITGFAAFTGTQLKPNVVYTEAMVEPAHERRTDWWIGARLMQALGLPSPLDEPDHDNGWKMINMLLGTHDLSVEKLREQPHQVAQLEEYPKNSLFERSLLHKDKKIDCCPSILAEYGLFERFETLLEELKNEPKDQLKLISMRTTHMHNSWMSNVDKMRHGNLSENALRIGLEDAESRGLFDGDQVKLSTEYGELTCRLEIRDDLRQGVVAMSHGYGQSAARNLVIASSRPGTNYNRILPTGCKTYEPLSYMSWMCGVPVRLEKVVV